MDSQQEDVEKLKKYQAPVVVGEATDPVSFITLSWLSRMVWVGGKRPLRFEDLPLIPERSRAVNMARILDPFQAELKTYLKDPEGKKAPSYLKDVWRFLAVPYCFAVFLDVCGVALQTTQPAVMAAILSYLQTGDPQFFIKSPMGLAVFYFFMSFLSLIFRQATMQMFRRMWFGLRSALLSAVYAKSLKLTNKSSNEFTKGRILQMVNSDVPEVAMSVQQSHQILIIPFQLAFSFWYLANLFGKNLYPVGIVAGIFLVIVPVIIYLFVTNQTKYLEAGDKRLASLREVLEGMKMVKLRGQETHFTGVLMDARNKQLSAIAVLLADWVIFLNLGTLVPYSMMIGTFAVYASTTTTLNPVIIFPAAQYFFNILEPITMLPVVFFSLGQTLVSWNRIRAFLLADEKEFATLPLDESIEDAIKIENGTFEWVAVKKDEEGMDKKEKKKEADSKGGVKQAADVEKAVNVSPENDSDTAVKGNSATLPLFKNLNLSIPAGKMTAVVGTVGSGKSSLLSAIIGEMTTVEGSVTVYGSVALCQQQPWLMSMNLQSNILFGNVLDELKLAETIRVCGLQLDVQQLQNGLDTEIGEKGIALSGGQKARVALARAIYSAADVYLFDDPLSALDAHVGKQVFEDCIKTHLLGKTRVLVTHQLHVLPYVDNIIVLEKGQVVEQGTYEYLAIHGPEDGVLREMLKNHALQKEEEENEEKSAQNKSVKAVKAEEAEGSADSLLKDEERQTGAVGKQYVINYIRESGGFGKFGIVILASLLYAAATFCQNLFMVFWTNDSESGQTRFGLQPNGYVPVYAVIVAATTFFSCAQTGIILSCSFVATKRYHNKAIAGLMRAPMSWFDSQPIGRIINRLTKDVESLDLMIGGNMFQFFMVASLTLANVSQVIYSTAYTLILIALLLIVSYYLLELYRSTQREIRRINQISQSPLTAYISECLGGTSTIRSFQARERSIEKQLTLTDISVMPEWTLNNVYNWFSLRIEGGLALMVLFIVLYAVLAHVDAAVIGLALSGVSNLGSTFFQCITAFSRLESNLVSAERLDYYCNSLEAEAPDYLDTDPTESQWPSQGQVSISDLEVKYSSKFDPVIKELSVEIKGGEKVGVVGRTGSGKSTLMLALFRLVPPSKGTVKIDGLDVAQLGLHTLRSRLQIIPQEPVLFSGTLRKNLDVEGKFTDSDLWEALELVGLKEYVSELPEKLDAPVAERGENLSVGQRQLMMLASAICHKPKILVMDEASSSVDQAADLLIQSSIRTHFANTTVISIAHRVNTIADFDRIMVLDAGRLVEFDTPIHLLRREDSIFKSLVDATGAANAQVVTSIAESHT